jgi:glycosyltransferase involved in cell wall biosynthesis
MDKVTFEVHELPERLSLRGHSIDFIDFPEAVKLKGWRRCLDLQTTKRLIKEKTLQGSSVRLFTPGRVFTPPFDRLLASLTFVRLLRARLRSEKYDAIVLYAVPTNGWQTILLAKRYRVPVVFRGIDIAHLIRETTFKPFIQIAERFVYRKADTLSLNNPVLASYCVREGSSSERTTVLLPGLDLEHFSPGEKNQDLLNQYGITNTDFVIVFMGTFFNFSGLDEVLIEFSKRRHLLPQVKLLLIGGGDLDNKISALISSHQLEDCVIRTGFISYQQLPEYLRLANVAICPFRPEKVANHALPWKVIQYLGIGLPVVSTRLLGLASIMNESDGIQFVESTTEMLDVIIQLRHSVKESVTLAAKGHSFATENFDWKKQEIKFEELIREVIRNYQDEC